MPEPDIMAPHYVEVPIPGNIYQWVISVGMGLLLTLTGAVSYMVLGQLADLKTDIRALQVAAQDNQIVVHDFQIMHHAVEAFMAKQPEQIDNIKNQINDRLNADHEAIKSLQDRMNSEHHK